MLAGFEYFFWTNDLYRSTLHHVIHRSSNHRWQSFLSSFFDCANTRVSTFQRRSSVLHLSRYSLRWQPSCLSLLSIMYLNWWNASRIHSYPSQLMTSRFFCILYMTLIFCPYFQRVPSYFIVLNPSFTLPSSVHLVKLPSLSSSPTSQTSSLKCWSHAFLISPLTNLYDWDYICIYYLFSLHCHFI